MNKSFKFFAVALTSATLLAGQAPLAYAKIGGGSSSSSSRSFSSSRSVSSSSSSRLGGGGSVGMQRPSVMNSVRQSPAPAPTPAPRQAPAPTPAPVQQAQPAQPSKSSSWKPALLGAAAGAAATYALTHNSNPQQAAYPQQQAYPQQAPQYAQPNYPQQGYAAPATFEQGSQGAPVAPNWGGPVPAPAPSSGGGFMSFLFLALLAAGGYFLWKRYTNSQPSKATTYGTAPATVPMKPAFKAEGLDEVKFFIELQRLNSEGDAAGLKQVTTPQFFAEIEKGIGATYTTVVSVQFEVVDVADEPGQTVVSVRYGGYIREGDSTQDSRLDEVWHYIKENGESTWKLAGIEQV